MPPVSLIRNVTMRGKYYYLEDFKGLKIPVNMQYYFG
jgi:CRISPR-associated protein Csc1